MRRPWTVKQLLAVYDLIRPAISDLGMLAVLHNDPNHAEDAPRSKFTLCCQGELVHYLCFSRPVGPHWKESTAASIIETAVALAKRTGVVDADARASAYLLALRSHP